jgi:hypothetical protein
VLRTLADTLQRLVRKPEPIADSAALGRFLDSRAAFLAQKGIVEFCRVRAGIHWQKLFGEEEFRRALSHSTWQAYAPALALVCEMVEAVLRPHVGIDRQSASRAIVAIARERYLAYPTPEGFTAAQWAEGFDLVARVIAERQGEAARPVRDMPREMARLVFAALPMHPSIVTNDADYIHNNLRMNLLRAHDDFLAVADLNALSRDLLPGEGRS